MILIEFLNTSFLQYCKYNRNWDKYDKVQDFIYRQEKCLSMIFHVLDLGYNHNDLMIKNLYRSQHILITFLLGFGISQHFNLLQGVNTINNMPDHYLWMLTSLVHDYGYLNAGLSQKQELNNINGKYNLLSDKSTAKQLSITSDYSYIYPQFLTYPYDIIKYYYNYRKEKLNKYDNIAGEAIDHGIYGACKCYEDYCDFYIKHEFPRSCISPTDNKAEIENMGYELVKINNDSNILKLARTEPLLYKTACLITAQHNMFRSLNEETDREYEEYGLYPLLSTKPIAISKENALLYLLSIVDTIECTKTFERLSVSNDKNVAEFSLSIKKVLNSVSIELNDDGITVDYSGLETVIGKYRSLVNAKEKRTLMKNKLFKQVEYVKGLKDWIECKTHMNNEYSITVKI